MSFDSRTFRNALGCFPTGVVVVTAMATDGVALGVTVSSFTSLSLDPPLVLFCLDNQNVSLPSFKTCGHFAVNVLSGEQRGLSIRFASRLDDKWTGIAVERGSNGAPILQGCLAVFECSIVEMHQGGDHQIVIGRVERVGYQDAGRPLLFYRGSYAEIADGGS